MRPRGLLPETTLAVLLLLAGCAGRHGIGREHLRKEEYEAALAVYSQILEENPKDASAAQGILKAREGIIGQRLISIRFARLAQSLDSSLESLRRLLEDEKNWGVFPAGAVFMSQKEETREAFRHFTNVIDVHLDARHPVPARLFFERYQGVFWSEETLPRLQGIRKNIERHGRESCETLAKLEPPNSFYYREFIDRYCRYWSAGDLPGSRRAAKDLSESFGRATLDCEISNLPVESTFIEEQLQHALEISPFYDRSATQPLEVKLHGQFRTALSEAPVSLEHSYVEREPYTDYVQVKRKRLVPYDDLVEISSAPYRVEKVRKVRTEEYFEQELRTRFRDVSRIHRFEGVRYRQDLILLVNGKASVGPHGISLNLYEADHREGVAHDADLPAIGLRRKPKETLETASWFKAKSRILQATLSERLESLWYELHCRPNSMPSSAYVEAMHKCRQIQRGMDSEFVVRWFQANIGVRPSEMLEALSK